MFLLKDTTQWYHWGPNPRPFSPSQELYHWAIALPITLYLGSIGRALDHPILGPKFGPIPNAKKYGFFPIPDKNSQFDKKKIFFFLFSIFIIQNILLHIYIE